GTSRRPSTRLARARRVVVPAFRCRSGALFGRRAKVRRRNRAWRSWPRILTLRPLVPRLRRRGLRARTPEEGASQRGYVDAPTQPRQPALQLLGRMRHLDRAERRAVRQAPADHLGARSFDQLTRRAKRVVYEQDAPLGLQALADQRPELLEALERDVREPEAKEHDVVGAIGPPVEDVC